MALDCNSSIDTELKQKPSGRHLKCTLTVEYTMVLGLQLCSLDSGEKTWQIGLWLPQNTCIQLQVDHLYTYNINFVTSLCGFIMQHDILIKDDIFIELVTQHTEAPLLLTMCWNMEHYFELWLGVAQPSSWPRENKYPQYISELSTL